MSDFNTFEVEVIVKVRVSAYDLEQAYFVAEEVLKEDKTIVEVSNASKVKGDSFQEGARYVLEYLHDVYGEGIEETDVWADYMDDEEEAE
jgi:hypothetical protein